MNDHRWADTAVVWCSLSNTSTLNTAASSSTSWCNKQKGIWKQFDFNDVGILSISLWMQSQDNVLVPFPSAQFPIKSHTRCCVSLTKIRTFFVRPVVKHVWQTCQEFDLNNLGQWNACTWEVIINRCEMDTPSGFTVFRAHIVCVCMLCTPWSFAVFVCFQEKKK